MLKKIIFVVSVCLLYLAYSFFVLRPSSFKNFTLVDDGQSIEYSAYIWQCLELKGCNKLYGQLTDTEGGRSRSTYWLLTAATFGQNGWNAQLLHELRIYGLGLIVVTIFTLICLESGAGFIETLLGFAIFVGCYSFTENFVRLGPVEPYMVLFLGIFSFLLVIKKNYILSFISLVFFLFLKESSIAVFPAVIALVVLFPKKFKRKSIVFISIFSFVLFGALKAIFSLISKPSTVNYVGEYSLSLKSIINGLQGFSGLLSAEVAPFIAISLGILILGLINKKTQKIFFDPNVVYWTLNTIFFTAILFPWRYILDRYLLVSIFSFSILSSLIFSKAFVLIKSATILEKLKKPIFGFGVVLFLSNLFFIGYPLNLARSMNYVEWFGTFSRFEADQVRAIADYNASNTVYLNAIENINDWEYLYELPLHLQYLYGSANNTRLLSLVPEKGSLIFSSSVLDEVGDLKDMGSENLVSKYYSVPQVDLQSFVRQFRLRPIQTVIDPPLVNEPLEYHWEVIKI